MCFVQAVMSLKRKTSLAIEEISRAAEEFSLLKADLKQLMEPLTGWEQFLEQAPLSVAMFGKLMLLSSKQDFSLKKLNKKLKK